MKSSILLLGYLVLAGCSSSEAPDARVPVHPRPVDAGAGGTSVMADAPEESAPADAAAEPADAPTAEADAPMAPDAGPPDAPIPTGPAELLINEVSPNMGYDLAELVVVRGGTVAGIKLEQNYMRSPVLLATLPDVIVSEGDIVVVHIAPEGSQAQGETLSIDEKSTPANFDSAWDFLGTSGQLQYSNVILSLRGADGKIASAVPFTRSDLTMNNDGSPRFFPTDLQAIIDAGYWDEACTPSPCSLSSNLSAVTVGWLGVGRTSNPSAPDGASVSRKPDGLSLNKASDWQTVPSAAPYNSYGAAN